MKNKPLRDVLKDTITTHFNRRSYELAKCAKLDAGQLSRLVSGARFPSPSMIGHIAANLPTKAGDELIEAYLRAVAEKVADAVADAKAGRHK